MAKPKSLTKSQLFRHLKNLQSSEILNAFTTFYELIIEARKRRLTDSEKLEKESVEKILGIEQRGEYLLFKNAKIIKHLPTGENFIFEGASPSFVHIIDGDFTPWEIDFAYFKLPKNIDIGRKQEIVKSKLGCDARRKLGGGGG